MPLIEGLSFLGLAMPQSYISPRFSAIDSNGRPLVGGKLYTYINGTTTPQVTYQDADGLAANTNPIILDARGEAVIFLTEGVTYTLVLKDADDALIWSQDSVTSAADSSGAIPSYPSIPVTDVGSPIYVASVGWLNWNGSAYVSDYSTGFFGGAFAFRNKIINGCFRVAQRGTTFGPITSGSGNPYTFDRWHANISGAASIGVTRVSGYSDYGQGRIGYYGARITSNASAATVATDKNRYSQLIEGASLLAFALGTLWGGSMTLSFWVRASIAGTYSVAFLNSGAPGFRSYVTNYTVNVANAVELKTVTIPIDASGIANWNQTNGIGLQVVFDLGSGSNYEGASNTWLSTETVRTTGSVRVTATSGATIDFSNVQLEFGTQKTPFEDRPIGVEYEMAKRYYRVSGVGTAAYAISATSVYVSAPSTAAMRATPTRTFASSVGFVDFTTATTYSASPPGSGGVSLGDAEGGFYGGMTGFSGMTAGRVGSLNTFAAIRLDAELYP